jgi:hypothetical protein
MYSAWLVYRNFCFCLTKSSFPLSRLFILGMDIYWVPCHTPYDSRPLRKFESKVSARTMQRDKLLMFLTYFPFRRQNSWSSLAWIACSRLGVLCYTFISWFYSRIYTFFGRLRVAVRNDPKVFRAYTWCQLQSAWIITSRLATVEYSREVRSKGSSWWCINSDTFFLDIFHIRRQPCGSCWSAETSKHARNNRSTSVYCTLLGNKQLNNEFTAVSAVTLAMQWFGKHVKTIEAEFSVRSARRLYNAILVIFGAVLDLFSVSSKWSQFSASSRREVNAVTVLVQWRVNNGRGRSKEDNQPMKN